MPTMSHTDYKLLVDEPFLMLNRFISDMVPSQIIILVDDNTARYCLPILKKNLEHEFSIIEISSGEYYKNLDTCQLIWNELLEHNVDRQGLMINLGGGVIGDMGGFVASTYKRGIRFIQMPTTLLSQVDASLGGKLGIDFQFQKNMIGLFRNPSMVFIQSQFLKTLNDREIKSGFAEIIKHGLIQSQSLWEQLTTFKLINNEVDFEGLILQTLNLKSDIVQADPFEKGLRKILNFGHTIGHAIESFYLRQGHDIRHGEAIAAGMICESFLSTKICNLDSDELRDISDFLSQHYSYLGLLRGAEDTIVNFCRKDKKNLAQNIQFSLLNQIGKATYNNTVSEELIHSSLDYYHSLYIR